MDFLKAVLGDRYEEFVNLIKGYNEKPENKDKQVKLIDLNKGEYVSKAKYDEADTARNTLRSQLDEAEETLRGFEGVDVKQLQTDLADLTTKMGTQKEEYENQIAQMKFDAILDAAITTLGGRNAEIGKVYTCETYSTENCPHSAADKPGTVTEYKVTGTADTTKLNVTEGKPEAGTIAAGDQLIVNGYTYTVTEALALAGGEGTLKVDQNLPADIETATPVKVINKAHALGFHRNGIALVTRQLELPMGASKAHIASANGLAVRVVMDYDPQTKKDTVSFDCIYGIKELDTSLLVDFS